MDQTQKLVLESCRHLELSAEDMDITLALRRSDVPALEEIVKSFRQFGDQAALNGACFLVGSYLGEIIRLQVHGTWTEAERDNGLPMVKFGDTTINTYDKVRKFAAEPDKESLVFYADVLVAGAKL